MRNLQKGDHVTYGVAALWEITAFRDERVNLKLIAGFYSAKRIQVKVKLVEHCPPLLSLALAYQLGEVETAF